MVSRPTGGLHSYLRWVLEFLETRLEQTLENGGILLDNFGPSGRIGECLDGQWWGGHYGWRWPHGGWVMLEAVLIACTNALLLTGDTSRLHLIRSQIDQDDMIDQGDPRNTPGYPDRACPGRARNSPARSGRRWWPTGYRQGQWQIAWRDGA